MKINFRKCMLVIFTLLAGFYGVAQQPHLIWNYSKEKIADKTYKIHLTASIKEGWHTYSQYTPEGGPFSTKINFIRNPFIIISGKPQEVGELRNKYEEAFGVNVKYFCTEVDFVQVVKVKVNLKTTLIGTTECMVCNDKTCLPPSTVKFIIPLN